MSVPSINDSDDFTHTQASLAGLGLSADMTTSLFAALRGILYLGNVLFEDYEAEEGDGSRVTGGSKGMLEKACLSYGLKSVDVLERALTVRSVMVAGGCMYVCMGVCMCCILRMVL